MITWIYTKCSRILAKNCSQSWLAVIKYQMWPNEHTVL